MKHKGYLNNIAPESATQSNATTIQIGIDVNAEAGAVPDQIKTALVAQGWITAVEAMQYNLEGCFDLANIRIAAAGGNTQ